MNIKTVISHLLPVLNKNTRKTEIRKDHNCTKEPEHHRIISNNFETHKRMIDDITGTLTRTLQPYCPEPYEIGIKIHIAYEGDIRITTAQIGYKLDDEWVTEIGDGIEIEIKIIQDENGITKYDLDLKDLDMEDREIDTLFKYALAGKIAELMICRDI